MMDEIRDGEGGGCRCEELILDQLVVMMLS